jgi:hypothetical protein
VSSACSREGAGLHIAAVINKHRKVEVPVNLRKCISAAKIRQCDTVSAKHWGMLQNSYTQLEKSPGQDSAVSFETQAALHFPDVHHSVGKRSSLLLRYCGCSQITTSLPEVSPVGVPCRGARSVTGVSRRVTNSTSYFV